MKIAIVHDYIKEYGGAERVLEALHEIWPDAPVYTLVYCPKFLGPHRERFKNWKIKTSVFQYVPFKEKLISPLRIIAPLLFKTFDFSKFDIVIVSATGAYSPNSIRIKNKELGIKGRKPIHICYCHTPPRYLYGFATAREWKKNIFFRVMGEIANHFLRMVDFKSAQNVDYFIANSHNVKNRISKFYRRESVVIYPPVAIESRIKNQESSKKNHNSKFLIPNSYYVAGGRLARPKHIDLIVETCEALNLPLKVFGKDFANYEIELKSKVKSQKSKVKFVGEVTDEEKMELMRNAKAYIFAAEDEDFGITPVEAMSVGTPVIAYRSGGVQESVVEDKTGLFFNGLTVESLASAMKQFNNVTIDPSDCIVQAEKFSKERFKKEIEEFVKKASNC